MGTAESEKGYLVCSGLKDKDMTVSLTFSWLKNYDSLHTESGQSDMRSEKMMPCITRLSILCLLNLYLP